ncbi:MAG: Uma2 family endonuclease [Mogibacterium sp.]|nr:Uma2 family endonuclease [Mogibacterium sp.]
MKIEDLKKRKEELGYTNEMVSKLSGVPLGTVQKFFGGATSKPRYNTLQSIECILFPELHSKIEDWKNLPDGAWMELIDGVLYDRNYPTKRHQYIASQLVIQLSIAIKEKGGPCLVLGPAGVQPDENDDRNGFIPDVLIVCDKEKYTKDEETIVGAPDYVAEVLSPSTEKYDRTLKLNKYWQKGVREYWLIDIKGEEVTVYQFEKGVPPVTYGFEEQIPLGISEGAIVIDFKDISDGMKRFFG